MRLTRSVPGILRTDLVRVLRDRFLLGTSAYIVGLAIVLRWVLPWITAELRTRAGFDLTPYHTLIVSYFALANAGTVSGVVAGFLLLEQREERTVQAMLVTPTPLAVPLGVLGTAVVLTSTTLALVQAAVVGIGLPPWGPAVVAALLVGPSGAVLALLTATLADNKVEAFAVLKITGLMAAVPLVAWFVPEPWQLAMGVVPQYWACKIWWAAEAGAPWAVHVGPAVVVSGAWLAILVHRFRRVVGQ